MVDVNDSETMESTIKSKFEQDENSDTERTPLMLSDRVESRYEAIRNEIAASSNHSDEESVGSSLSMTSPIYDSSAKLSLVLFALFSFFQSSVFVDWNPIENSVIVAFRTWTETTISWQANIATMPSSLVQGPLWLLLRRFKLSTIIKWMGMLPLFLATSVRVIPLIVLDDPEQVFTILVFISSFIVGVVGVLFYSSISKFSSTYFGSAASTFPTGVVMMASNIGVVFASVIGPFIVDDPTHVIGERKLLQGEIRNYLLMYAILVGTLTIVMIFVFPEPTYVGQVNQVPDIMDNLGRMTDDKDNVFLLIVNALSSVPIYWSSTFLPIYFQRYKFGQEIIGVLMSTSVGLSVFETVLTTKLVDSGKVRPWKMILGLLCLQFSFTMIMSLFIVNVLPSIPALIATFFVLSNSIALSMGPHIIPYGTRLGQNLSEEILNGAFHQTSSFFGAFFLFIFAIDTQRDWVPYCLTVCPFLAFLLFVLVKNVAQ